MVGPPGVASLSREFVVSGLWLGSWWTTSSGADFPVRGEKGEEGGRCPGQHREDEVTGSGCGGPGGGSTAGTYGKGD